VTAFDADFTGTQLSGAPTDLREERWLLVLRRRRGTARWRLWQLYHDLSYQAGYGAAGVICVPAGFITDGPSIPQFLWALLPGGMGGPWTRAGIVHDFACCLIAMGRPHELAPTRKAADKMFTRMVWDSDTGWWVTGILFLGVSFGRWFNLRTTMVDHNVKLSAILEKRVKESSREAVEYAESVPIGGDTPLPLISDHPHTFAALEAEPREIVADAVLAAKTQVSGQK
jgi:hypothetical protein